MLVEALAIIVVVIAGMLVAARRLIAIFRQDQQTEAVTETSLVARRMFGSVYSGVGEKVNESAMMPAQKDSISRREYQNGSRIILNPKP